MKKVFKKLVLSVVVLMALIGIGGTAAFASGYLEWGGSDDFRQAMINLNLISDRGKELQGERDTLQDTVDAKEEKIKGLEADLVTAQNSVATKEEEIKGLKDDLGTAQGNLREVTKERDAYQGEREALTDHVSTVMASVRSKTGANRYQELAKGANHLAGLLGLDKDFPEGLGAVHQDALLEQAKEDMGKVLDKSQEVLDSLTE